MNISVHQRVKALIEETNDAFSECSGCMNTDFAEFATLALYDFKNALSAPGLTKVELIQILRKAMSAHKGKDPLTWSAFIATHVTRAANTNARHF